MGKSGLGQYQSLGYIPATNGTILAVIVRGNVLCFVLCLAV
jgi:hypothetical protein